MRKRLMFQFPVEIALAMALVSFERSCQDSRMSGYLAATRDTPSNPQESMEIKGNQRKSTGRVNMSLLRAAVD